MENRLFNRLLKSAEEMVAFEKGELPLPEDRVQTFTILDVKKIRLDNQLKQHELANVFSIIMLFQNKRSNRKII
ncbi:transcriptional regulator [Mergibacter septicus]|uniref:transcriptional regulator n=1 Tax=Mergibacter septicus TaxID=221402 RepID=UPI001178E564|nr:transcriptional regulator [Mergibacter septicus]AWX13559.1 transcriptional regulator [Mergibacter septicus]